MFRCAANAPEARPVFLTRVSQRVVRNENEQFFLSPRTKLEVVVGILWTLFIGFLAGVIAKFLHPGPNEPSGFIVTTLLGIAGAFIAAYLGQAIGWYRPGEGAGLIGAVVGAIIVLVVWGMVARRDARRT
jgi:uncharacterized membrane protein YeaQ/YmgE (transglycosylase-associated protein family)